MALVLGLAICSSTVLAQSGAGAIQGTVTDSTGAVIPGATIHVVNQATTVAASAVSNSVGFYQVPGLFTGTYTVTITAAGMKAYKTTIELQVAQNAVINPTMTAGSVTQQVEVAADVVQLTTTDNGTISSTLENNRINQLPMNGRLLLTLAGETTPGLEASGGRANGLMPEALEYVADGVPLTNRNFGGEGNSTQAQLPDPDSVQEVRVETTNTSAMYSEPATAIITTKSGTNSLHGSLFETARNNAVGIAKGRQNAANFAAPPLVRNEFGASAGGPIILPRIYHGKDKSFWFFAYERYSLAQQASELVTVPTQAMRQGDFSLLDPGSVQQQLYDPATTGSPACNTGQPNGQYCRLPFTNNQIPIGRLAPAAKTIYDITPQPTNNSDPFQAPNIDFNDNTYVVIPTITFRLDHSFNENNKAYLRYTSNDQLNQALRNYPSNSPDTVAADGFPDGASGYQDITISSFGAALGFTHVFSPTFFAETILSQDWMMQYVGGGGNPNLNYEQMLGLPNNFGETGFPNIGANLRMPYGGTQYQYQENQIISNIDENMTKSVGKHQMQFGARYRHERFGYLPDRGSDTIAFAAGEATGLLDPATVSTAAYSAAPNTGYEDADFFLGAASSYSVTQEPPYIHFHDMEIDGYFQDNYRVSKNFTVNIGLRYEAHPAPWVKYGLLEGFDLKNKAVVLDNPTSYYISHGYTTQTIITNLENLGVVFETPSAAGFPSAMIENRNATISPRLGIAYLPFGGKHGTVIRGAYGRYIYPIPTRNYEKAPMGNEPWVTGYSQSYTSASQAPDSLPNYLLRTPQSVIMGTNSTNVVNSTTTNAILPGFSLGNLDPDTAPDFVTQMNFTVEQPLKGNSALRVTWLWSHGTNLDHYYYYNTHPSSYAWEMNTGTAPPNGGASTIGTNQYASTGTGPYDQITYGGSSYLITKDGWSNDNALQANYQRLFHHGIAYQLTYVWSKPFRVGGNTFRDGNIYTAQAYASGSAGTMTSPFGTLSPGALPPPRPAGIAPYANWHALQVFEEYKVDTAIPKQHITFNGIVDLPFGRGKRFLGNSNRLVDELAGGWQVAGDGSIASQDFAITSTNWGPAHPLKTYKHGAPITDCRSGTCNKAYLWFNGYIAPNVINASTKGVSGLPSNYQAYQSPIDSTVGTTYYNTNTVNVTLANGTTGPVGYAPAPTSGSTTLGSNPFSNTVLNGPINWTADLSLFKVFPITERTNLRFNVDAFNAFNVQGFTNPSGTDGTEQVVPQVASSYNTPRQVQFTLRLTF
ncbi:MAG TPA: carboxypeptidase-like regulatory domain-containing protein [Terracidiphilus sp.]|nr:carboxypeptidase-like regulatory domain-containing protein [Terracidiphilus sp.]